MSKQSHALNILRGGNQSPLKVANLFTICNSKRKEEILRFLFGKDEKTLPITQQPIKVAICAT